MKRRKVSGWSIEEVGEKPNIAVEEATEEMKKMERLKPERNGPMLEELN